MINYDFIELDSTKKSLALLELFYNKVYQPNFTNLNTSVSLEDMRYYLDRKTQGYSGKNALHIILALDNNHIPVAGAIVDYLAKANSGVLEFIVVDENNRNQGLGFSLFQHVEELLIEDARHIVRDGLDFIFLNTIDPMKDSENATLLKLFESWGFRVLDFPYVQPALSKDKHPVYSLIMLAASYRKDDFAYIPSGKIKTVLSEYFRTAMRIKPNQNKEFLEMQGYLDERQTIDVFPINKFLQSI